jgi:hypothetical protein
MSAELIDATNRFLDKREPEDQADTEPYLEGACRCLHCQHEWVGVAPIGVISLDCPECRLRRGVFVANVMRNDPHWVCNCGSMIFAINSRFTYCVACGQAQRF